MFINSIETVAMMAMLIAVGCIGYKARIISAGGVSVIAALVVNISNPATVFMAFQTTYSDDKLSDLGWSALLAVLAHVIGIAVSMLFVKGRDRQKLVLERASVLYTNCGFMGIPLVQSVFDADGVFCLAMFIAANNILVFTYGVSSMMAAGPSGSELSRPKRNQTKRRRLRFILALFAQPSLIAIFLGVGFFLLRLQLPGLLSNTVGHLADLTTPLAMMVAGATIMQSDFKKLLKKTKIYYVTCVKLILLPLIVYGAFLLIPAAPVQVRNVILVGAAMPAATMVTVLAVRYKKDAVYASEIFAMTTVLSLITLPFAVMLPFVW
jgi:predicted permease